MFKKTRHTSIIKQLGHFPTILALTTIPAIYRKKVKGKLELIGDSLAHFEPDTSEGLVWEAVEDMVSQFDLIGSRQLCMVSFMPPEGYSYLELFIPERQNVVLRG